MKDLSKAARHAIRQAADLAYERELQNELKELARSFDEWRAGDISALSLSEAIHDFHNGPARELFNRYGESSMADIFVAGALNASIISIEDIGEPGRVHILDLAGRLRAVAGER